MLNKVLAASAMIVATPVLAAAAPQAGKQVPAAKVTPSTATPGAPKATPPVQADSAATRPAPAAKVAVKLPAEPPKAADGAPQTAPRQVSRIVSLEFPAYDGNGDGVLDKTEFAAWMAALQAASPTADQPTKPWTAAAFKQADVDSSDTVTKEELAGFFNGAKVSAGG